MNFKRLLSIVLTVAAASGVAACGSTAPGVQLAPSAGAATAPAPVQPKVPANLSQKPVITAPKGTAPSHLVINDLIGGTGKTVSAGQTVSVNYVGALYKTGKEFDSSWSRNQLFTTKLTAGSVIPGWVQGISGMKVGGRRELIIPPSLGYGVTGNPPTIPGNSTLIFIVDLISVQ